jgi:glycolate oxidase
LLGWALAAGGQAGIERMLELLDIEIRTALGLMGIASLSQLDPSWVKPARVAGPISATSAYPWYEGHL